MIALLIMQLSLSILLALALLCPAQALCAGLTLRVIAGDNAINNIRRGTAFDPEVEVLDGDNTPLPGATVTFFLPAVGPGGTFEGGLKSLTVQTNEMGRALARGLRPNQSTGQFEIRVTASFRGQTASTVIRQTNAAPAVESNTRKRALIVGLVAAAAAGGLIAALSGGGGDTPPPPASGGGDPATRPGVITPGTPGFSAPR